MYTSDDAARTGSAPWCTICVALEIPKVRTPMGSGSVGSARRSSSQRMRASSSGVWSRAFVPCTGWTKSVARLTDPTTTVTAGAQQIRRVLRVLDQYREPALAHIVTAQWQVLGQWAIEEPGEAEVLVDRFAKQRRQAFPRMTEAGRDVVAASRQHAGKRGWRHGQEDRVGGMPGTVSGPDDHTVRALFEAGDAGVQR